MENFYGILTEHWADKPVEIADDESENGDPLLEVSDGGEAQDPSMPSSPALVAADGGQQKVPTPVPETRAWKASSLLEGALGQLDPAEKLAHIKARAEALRLLV